MAAVSNHAAIRLSQRAGINAGELERLLKGRVLPDGEHATPFGVLIVSNGRIVTLLDDDMAVVHRATHKRS